MPLWRDKACRLPISPSSPFQNISTWQIFLSKLSVYKRETVHLVFPKLFPTFVDILRFPFIFHWIPFKSNVKMKMLSKELECQNVIKRTWMSKWSQKKRTWISVSALDQSESNRGVKETQFVVFRPPRSNLVYTPSCSKSWRKTGKNHKFSKTTTSQSEGNQGVKNCKNGSIVEMSNWGVKEKQFVFFRPHIPPSYTPHYTLHPLCIAGLNSTLV